MKCDMNPSVVCGLFCTQKGYKEFMNEVDGKNGMRVREIRFVDIGIPLDDTFNDNINFLKAGSMPMLKRLAIIDLPFGLKDKLFNKLKMKPFSYSKPWKYHKKNKMIFSGLTPLAVDDKYSKDDVGEYTDDEKEKCKRLLSWDTPNYMDDDDILMKKIKEDMK